MTIEQRIAERLADLSKAVTDATEGGGYVAFPVRLERLADFANRVNNVVSMGVSRATYERNLDELLSAATWKP